MSVMDPPMKETKDCQSSSRHVIGRALYARQNVQYTDCIFHVTHGEEKGVFHAHKLMLFYASCVFEAMFYGPLASDKPVVIEDISPKAFSALLDCIYTGELNQNLTVDIVVELWYAAEKYQMKYLFEDCEKYFLEKTNGRNVGAVLNQARLLKNRKIEAFCWNIIESNTDYNQTDLFEDMSKELLLELLEKDDLSVESELELFKGVERRCQLECEAQNLDVTTENLRVFGQDLLHKIRFLCFDPDTVSLTLANSKLLSNEEKEALANSSSFGGLPLPDGFSLRKETRIKYWRRTGGGGLYDYGHDSNSYMLSPVKSFRKSYDLIGLSPLPIIAGVDTGYVFSLSFMSRFDICIDHIIFLDCAEMKKVVIRNNKNEVIFKEMIQGLVLKERLICEGNDWYTLEVTLFSSAPCTAYPCPNRWLESDGSWAIRYDLPENYLYDYSFYLKSTSDFILVKEFDIAKPKIFRCHHFHNGSDEVSRLPNGLTPVSGGSHVLHEAPGWNQF